MQEHAKEATFKSSMYLHNKVTMFSVEFGYVKLKFIWQN